MNVLNASIVAHLPMFLTKKYDANVITSPKTEFPRQRRTNKTNNNFDITTNHSTCIEKHCLSTGRGTHS